MQEISYQNWDLPCAVLQGSGYLFNIYVKLLLEIIHGFGGNQYADNTQRNISLSALPAIAVPSHCLAVGVKELRVNKLKRSPDMMEMMVVREAEV